MARKIMVGMSGGVDSSVAAYLLKKQGYEVTGVTFKLWDDPTLESGCCSADDMRDAAYVCQQLGIPHYVLNYKDLFRQEVVGPFAEEYLRGRTPNPCISCNRYIKFGAFSHKLRELGFDLMATGHYACCGYNEATGRWELKRAIHPEKDQSYVLYNLTQEQLAMLRLPLGEYSKPEIRAIAEESGLVVAKKPDSQDICFVPDGDYAKFIEQYTGRKSKPGDFVDMEGNILGRHKGIIHYTLGQRRGLGIPAAARLYVCDISPKTNQVVLGSNEDLFHTELTAEKVNLISCESLKEPMRLKAKIRYRHPEQDAVAWQTEDGVLHVRFDKPQRAITKGQAVVLYDGDIVVGGGVIESCMK